MIFKLKKPIVLSIVSMVVLAAASLFSIPIIMSSREAGASGTITVSHAASPATVTVGANITVTANISVPTTLNPMGALRTRFDYNPAFLEFVSQSSSGTAFDSCTYTNNAATSNLPQFVCSSTTGALYSGRVASVTFKTLQVGSTTVNGVTMTNQATDNTASPYTINFTPANITINAPSTNADLAGLTVNTGTLTPAFSPATTSYTVSVPNATSSITITATAPAGGSKSGDGAKSLSVGDNTYTIVSTAESGATKNYTVVVNRAAPVLSSNANLSALSVSGYSIQPAFSADHLPYTLTVPYAAATVTINATAADAGATVAGTGSKSLSVGSNPFTIEVTAANGTKKFYTIDITRADDIPVPDTGSDSTLKSLAVSGYTLTPSFSPSRTHYTMSVANTVTGLTVTAIPNDPNASVAVTGNSGWLPGVNNILIKVTAEDGSQTFYTVAVTRAGSSSGSSSTTKPSSDNSLSLLKESTGLNLFVDFDPKITSYDLTVPYEVDHLGVIAVASHPKATVEIIGDDDFKVGMNNVLIKVTAEDGSQKYYTLNVIRSAASGELKNLIIDGVAITPRFDPLEHNYKASVGHKVDCIDILATPLNPDVKVTVLDSCNLAPGKNLVKIRVEYEKGKFTYYYLEVDKAHPPTIFGMAPWLFWTLLGSFLLLLFIIILLLIKRRRSQQTAVAAVAPPPPPAIEFHPEFNFSSKNNTDSQNDVISGDESAINDDAPISLHVPPAPRRRISSKAKSKKSSAGDIELSDIDSEIARAAEDPSADPEA